MTLGDEILAKHLQIKSLRRLQHQLKGDENRDERYQRAVLPRESLEDEVTQLVWQSIEGSEAHSDPVFLDSGVGAFIVHHLLRVKTQLDKELARSDLYPNVRDKLFKRRRAFEDVIRIFSGEASEENLERGPMYLLTAEFDDDTVDFAEATDDEDADRLLEHYMDDGALVQIYAAASMSGHYVLLHSPVLEQDNAYEALPADILIRTIRAVGIENLRLPEGFEIPEIPESLLSTPGRTEVEE